MKKIIIFLLPLILTGCTHLKTGPVSKTTKEIIEDWSAYQTVTDADEKNLISDCGDNYEEFLTKLRDGEVKKLVWFQKGAEQLVIYSTPNYSNWATEEFRKLNGCAEFGGPMALKAYPDKLLWGFPYCSSGAEPDEKDSDFSDYRECQKSEKELLQEIKL